MKYDELIQAWRAYLATVDDWEKLVAGIEPKAVGCGLVYELSNPIERPNESFCIADMRRLAMAEPHRHTGGETEVYFCLQGRARVFIGDEECLLTPGDHLVTPAETTHITIPDRNFVIAVVNTPPFNPANYVVADKHDTTFVRALNYLRSN